MDTYDRIVLLLEQKGEKPSDLAKATGISTGLLSQWKSRMQKPSNAKLALVAKHFEVSMDYLLTGEQKEKSAAKSDGLTDRDKRDIARDLEKIMADIENRETVMFDGDPASDAARETLRNAIAMGLEYAKKVNKETYTPKKYRKEE